MDYHLLEGKTLASEMRDSLKEKINSLKSRYGKAPFLYAVDPQFDEASTIYLKKEIEVCNKLGINTFVEKVKSDISKEKFSSLIKAASSDKKIDSILIPKPLPSHLSEGSVWQNLAPEKDIDASSILNMGHLFNSKSFENIKNGGFFVPCTALAVVRILEYHKISVKGKNVVVLGRSSAVGRPLAHMLTSLDATVTLCHSKTKNIENLLKNYPIVISAVGKPRFVKEGMIKKGAVVVDVGTNVDEDGVFCGDVDFKAVSKKVSAITPVPGGVGPVTLACLLENIVISAFKNTG